MIRIDIPSAIAEAEANVTAEQPFSPTISRKFQPFGVTGLQIYNILGQNIREIREPGIYFVAKNHEITKIIIID